MSGRHIPTGSRRRMLRKCLICQCFFLPACVYPGGAGQRFSGDLTRRVSPCQRGKGAGAIGRGDARLLDARPKTRGRAGMSRSFGVEWVGDGDGGATPVGPLGLPFTQQAGSPCSVSFLLRVFLRVLCASAFRFIRLPLARNRRDAQYCHFSKKSGRPGNSPQDFH
jgi:hypothetical protein